MHAQMDLVAILAPQAIIKMNSILAPYAQQELLPPQDLQAVLLVEANNIQLRGLVLAQIVLQAVIHALMAPLAILVQQDISSMLEIFAQSAQKEHTPLLDHQVVLIAIQTNTQKKDLEAA